MTSETTTLLTAEEFDALGDIGRAELVRGEVVPLSKLKPRHGRIAMRIGVAIAGFVSERRLREVYAGETGFVAGRDPDSVRVPDVSFVRAERVVGHGEDEWHRDAPDLAVEVLSPTDGPGEVEGKVRMWLEAGGPSVRGIDPGGRRAAVQRNDGSLERIPERL